MKDCSKQSERLSASASENPEREAMPCSSRWQHTSNLSVASVASRQYFQPASQIEENIPATDPTEIARLWSSVFNVIGSVEDQVFSTESSSSEREERGKAQTISEVNGEG